MVILSVLHCAPSSAPFFKNSFSTSFCLSLYFNGMLSCIPAHHVKVYHKRHQKQTGGNFHDKTTPCSFNLFTISVKSCLTIPYLDGSRRMAEGWYVAVNAQSFRYAHVPCCLVILKSGEIMRCALTRPRQTITLGFNRNVSYFRCGKHASFSSSFGSRLPGGWHFKILVMYICSLSSPQSRKRLSNISPDLPTNGIPCWLSVPRELRQSA